MASMIWYLSAAVLSYLTTYLLLPIYRGEGRQNYLGEQVPVGLGSAFLFPTVLLLLLTSPGEPRRLLFAVSLLLFAMLGLLDDHLGKEGQKGFRGHLQGGFSTGALKFWGGGAAALTVASGLDRSWVGLVLNGGLIALGANFLNLLDLRPGRAGKAFLLFALPFLFLGSGAAPLVLLMFGVAGYLPWDLRRKAMMGDAGANPLGAALGFMAARYCPLVFKLVLLLTLAALNLLSEKISFSRVIEKNRFLHFLDKLGR